MTSAASEVAAELRRYCAAHPGGRDTLEGIAWWLAMQRCSETMDVLAAAVDTLVAQKVLTSYQLADGTRLFGCLAESAEAGTATEREGQP